MISLLEAFYLIEQAETFELPAENIIVSLFPEKNQITFSQIDKDKPNNRARSILNQIKQQFKIHSVVQRTPYMYELNIDPRENFYDIVDFIKSILDKNKI